MTPPVGIYHRMWGAATHDRATGIHRSLRATAAWFAPEDADGEQSASADTASGQMLIAIDHCILGKEELRRIVEATGNTAGVPAEQIAVVCSHTHAAGILSLDRVDLPGGDLIPPYLDGLVETIGELAAKARGAAQPASITYATGRCDLAAHRDFWDEAGERFVCGFNPEEDADDTVMVARIESDAGDVLGTVVNYACHPTTLAWDNTLISTDYPGAMREVVEEATGAPCLFLQGASGELGPREGFVGDVAVADRNGRQLGYAALSALTGLPHGGVSFEYQGAVESGATIGTWDYRPLDADSRNDLQTWQQWRGAIDLPYRSDLETAEQVRQHLERLESDEAAARAAGDDRTAQEHRTMAERRRRQLARAQALPPGEHFPWQVAVWRMGDAIWVCVQGEPYSLFQEQLREQFPQTPIIVASLGFAWSVAYLPPEDGYGKGLYQESVAVVAPGSLETALEQVAARIEQLLD